MKVLTEGHRYELANFDNPGHPGQVLQFIEKIPQVPEGMPGALVTVSDGTTNEEVLAVLIDRLKTMHDKIPSKETAVAITHIETALLWLQARTTSRKTRGVEGKALP